MTNLSAKPLKDNQIESAILKRAGIVEKEDTAAETNNQNILCNKCFTMNAPGSEYCRTCGEPLSRAAIERQLQQREISMKQQEEKSMTDMIKDVADIFGMSVDEFTAKMIKIKSL